MEYISDKVKLGILLLQKNVDFRVYDDMITTKFGPVWFDRNGNLRSYDDEETSKKARAHYNLVLSCL